MSLRHSPGKAIGRDSVTPVPSDLKLTKNSGTF